MAVWIGRSRPRALHNQIRGLSPFPGAYFSADFGKGPERVKVLRSAKAEGAGAPGTLIDPSGVVACGEGALRLLQVQPAGKQAMGADEFLRGRRLAGRARFLEMPRYKLIVEYDGTPVHRVAAPGRNGRSVQQAVEEAIGRFAGTGRADPLRRPHRFRRACHPRSCMWTSPRSGGPTRFATPPTPICKPDPVAVLSAEVVPETFNARLSAVKRHYLYRILNRRAPPALEVNGSGMCHGPSMPA